ELRGQHLCSRRREGVRGWEARSQKPEARMKTTRLILASGFWLLASKNSHDSQHRTGLSSLSPDRPGPHQAGPEEIHFSGRADRKKGKGLRQHSNPADPNAKLPLWPPQYR